MSRRQMMRSAAATPLRKFSPVLFHRAAVMELAPTKPLIILSSVLQSFKDLLDGENDGLGHVCALFERSGLNA